MGLNIQYYYGISLNWNKLCSKIKNDTISDALFDNLTNNGIRIEPANGDVFVLVAIAVSKKMNIASDFLEKQDWLGKVVSLDMKKLNEQFEKKLEKYHELSGLNLSQSEMKPHFFCYSVNDWE